MADNVNPIPANYRRINTCLTINGAAKAIEFYSEVFGARERSRYPGPFDTVAHAELEVGDSILMVEDAADMMGTQAPPAGGLPGSPVYNFVYVEDVDATIDKAAKLGATVKRPATDQFYGDRDGFIVDPFGHSWVIASHKEDLTEEEVVSRMNALFGQG
jgi:PhnB protein